MTKDEAIELLSDFKARVDTKRTIKRSQPLTDDVLDALDGSNLDLKGMVEDNSLEPLLVSLGRSEIPGFRGRRAVFIDVENDIIGVGTTVIYNENWASHGIVDPSVAATVLGAVADAA